MAYLLILSLISDRISITSEISKSQNPRTKKFGLDSIACRALEKCSQRDKKFTLTFNRQRINKKGPFDFLFVPLL